MKKVDVPLFLIGTLVMLFGITVSLLDVTASEAWMKGLAFVALKPSFETVLQPIQLIDGQLPAVDIWPVIIAWGVELVLIVCALGYEVSKKSLHHRNPKAAEWYAHGIVACLVFDFVTNFIYSGGVMPQLSGPVSLLLRGFVSGLAVGFTMFLPIIGFGFIVEAFGFSAGSAVRVPANRPVIPAHAQQGHKEP